MSMKSSDLAQRPLHVVFFPYMASGHMLPMVDMANIFAARGVVATVVATPANVHLVDSRRLPGATVGLRTLPFPSPALTGLPPGIENLSDLPDEASQGRFVTAVLGFSLREPFRRLLGELRPDAIVADSFLPWTIPEAEELGVPHLIFHGTGFFAQCAVSVAFATATPLGNGDTVVLSGLPHRVEMLQSQLPNISKGTSVFLELLNEIAAMEGRSYGVVVNSFYELEPDYVRYFREVMGRCAWPVGPFTLFNWDGFRMKLQKEDEEAQEQALELTKSRSYLLQWLDQNRPNSVLYVCFGSMARLDPAQLSQIAVGLEASGCPFIWVVRDSDDAEWMPHGFKERVKDRGLVLKGWVPQTLILGHTSVGGFVTHCGWNSCLEGVCAGVPMVTWPFYADQFFNERLIVDVLKIGVPVGATKFAHFAAKRPVIEAALIETAIRNVMGGGEKATEMQRRVRELGKAAKKAMASSGSSYVDLGNLIQELMDRRSDKTLAGTQTNPQSATTY